jgi:hypothetical protein
MADKDMQEEIESGDMRRALIAIRDYLVHELTGHRCRTCAMSQLKTGDTASLVLRLTKVLEDIEAIPDPTKAGEDELAKIRALHSGQSDASDSAPSLLGTKSGKRRQGGRKFSGPGGA